MARKLNIILVFCLLLITKALLGQQEVLYGVVYLKGGNDPIVDVHIRLQGHLSVTDQFGRFSIPYNAKQEASLHITHVSYVDRTLSGPFYRRDTLRIYLDQDVIVLKTPDITAAYRPQVVYESKTLHVAEYQVNADGIWMLNYIKPRLLKREHDASVDIYDDVELVLLDTNMHVLDSEALPNGMLGIYKDHEGQIMLKGKRGDLHAQYFNGHLIIDELKEGIVDGRLAWSDSSNGKLLGSNFVEAYPAFDHFQFDPLKGESVFLYAVEDKPLMELFRSEIKYLNGKDRVHARNLELRTGIDKEIHAAWMTGFHNDKYYKPLYAPLFVLNDTITIFDHYANTIRLFRKDLQDAGVVPIDYHLGRKGRRWEKELLHDESRNKIYALFAYNSVSWLECIEPRTGRLYERMELYHRYPEQIRVFNGYVYYVYRTFGSTQKKTLYREALRTSPAILDTFSDSQIK